MENQLEKIKDLNEKLTAENMRLLTELDIANDIAEIATQIAEEYETELYKIKSTFWYKLIHWKW